LPKRPIRFDLFDINNVGEWGDYAVPWAGLQGNFVSCGRRGVFVKVFRMFDDDPDPKKKAQKLRNLEPMSVDELVAYVEELKAEIVRVEADIAKKKAYSEAATSFFKK
jgi:uncharacterized small protein (DUF1192 family)